MTKLHKFTSFYLFLPRKSGLLLIACQCITRQYWSFLRPLISCDLTWPQMSWSISELRVRAVFHKTVWVCHVYCNFKIGFTCQITVIFGTLKDGSLLINTLASNICFSYRKNVPKWHRRFVKNSWRLFVKKLKILSSSDFLIMFKFC